MLKFAMAALAVALAAGLWWPAPAGASGHSAVRSFAAPQVAPGGTLEVTIEAAGLGGFGQVVETLPKGFAYQSSDLSAAGIQASGNTVSFVLLGTSSFTYTVTAPAEPGTYNFAGIVKDSYRAEKPVTGASAVRVGQPTTPTPGPTPTRAATPTPSPAIAPTATALPAPTPTLAPIAAPVPTPTPRPTATAAPTPTPAPTAAPTATPRPTATATPAPTPAAGGPTQEQRQAAAQSIAAATGKTVAVGSGPPDIQPGAEAGTLEVTIAVEGLDSGDDLSGLTAALTLGPLAVEAPDSAGNRTATLTAPNCLTVRGDAELLAEDGQLRVRLSNARLEYAPPAPSGSGFGAAFSVALNGLPAAGSLTAEFSEDPGALVADAGAVFSLAASLAADGGTLANAQTDVAFAVKVTPSNLDATLLGDNTVRLRVSREWYEARLSEGKSVTITKMDGEGNVFVAETQCAMTADGQGYECAATFTGEAGGFSTYALIAVTAAGPTPAAGLPPAAENPAPEATPPAAPDDGNGQVWIILGAVGGALALGLAAVAVAAFIVRRRRESRYQWRRW